ncbi:conjugative transfer system coupling protein TraD [Pseudoduganella ginsengisoli]|uniref:Conjugative transfer system coupling protein TraD n=1 Tax=Pseudoduganella ginsengisoli TaxID=1462440 RepID=A0A6L6PZD8_9BURK|nr:conjugative transfer system coupling protein TraD [Pseudoduganella ginsengisoli]MTW02745.1 conjugative transfer system coupling protein TraD [Pseudoduganella ginsengisoli]
MLMRNYEMPWRSPLELVASTTWAGAALGTIAGTPGTIPVALGAAMLSVMVPMTVLRARQGLRIVGVRAALSGRAMEMMTTKRLARLASDPDMVVFGFGFEWQPVHSQRLYELAKVDYRDLRIPPTVLKLLGYVVNPQPDDEIGLPYIHGVEQREKLLARPLQNFEGGTLVVGTTQSGKGVCLGWLITQAVKRGDVVIILDPKNSKRLKRLVEKACADYREDDTFLWFHPAFPETGVRLDFTFNWQKPTEIASRIQSILPPDTAGAFSAFGWDAVNVVTQGMVRLERRPNLMKLTKYIEAGIDPILEETLKRFYEELLGRGWRTDPDLVRLLEKARKGTLKSPSPVASAELVAFVEYYERHVHESRHDKVIDSQVRVFRHNREHYQKITANLLPILSMLTSGELGKTLSPEPFDEADERPIMNLEKIERGGHVLLMCLDSLPDPAVASAIGAMCLADLAARSGIRYNLGGHRRISLFVDEVSNVINQPLIEIMNKGAEGGIYTTVAMQTIADLAKRLGSQEAARMALGNLNNLIAFRTKDQPTQEFINETFGQTAIHNMKVGRNTARDGHLGDFTMVESTQIAEEFNELVPTSLLGKLPNLQFFASVSGGRLCKGRFTLLDPGAESDAGKVKEPA